MAPQEAISLANSVITLIKDAAPVLSTFGVGLLFILAWRRAGSAHFLFGRVWRLLGGDKEFSDPALALYWKQVRDLETVRFHTGIRFPSITSVIRTMERLNNNDIALGDFTKVKRFFDPERETFQDPKFAQSLILGWIALLISAFITLGLLWFNSVDEAFLTVKKTDTAFWTDGVAAKSWNRNDWLISKANCDAGTVPLADSHDVEVICELLSDSANPFIKNSLDEQRIVNGVIMCFCVILFFFTLKRLISLFLAEKLHRKLNP